MEWDCVALHCIPAVLVGVDWAFAGPDYVPREDSKRGWGEEINFHLLFLFFPFFLFICSMFSLSQGHSTTLHSEGVGLQ